MAKSAAERQAAYRARQDSEGADGNGQRRVSMWLSTGAALALERLALIVRLSCSLIRWRHVDRSC